MPEEPRAELLTPGTAPPAPWGLASAGLQQADTYWLGTTLPDGRPHLVPVLAVVVDGTLHFSASDSSRKARNLAAEPRCSVGTSGDAFDLVVEGTAAPVAEDASVRRVAAAYAAKYGWEPQVRDGLLWADGAPTAGPPPYRVYRVTPSTVFGFPTGGGALPTRWRFD